MAKTANQDWLPFFLLLALVVLSSIIIEDTPWGRVYMYLTVFTLFIYILAQTNKTRAEFILFNKKIGFGIQALTGFALGFFLIDSILFDQPLFALLNPLSVPQVTSPLGILGFEMLSQVFAMSLIVAEIEENFRAGALRPMIYEWLQSQKARTVFLLTSGIIIYAIVPPLRLIGALLFLVVFVDFIIHLEFLHAVMASNLMRHGIAIFAAAAVFGILHLKIFSAGEVINEDLMVNAFLFAFMADVINTTFQSTVASKIAHCWNNSAVMLYVGGTEPTWVFWISIMITLAYATILYTIQAESVQSTKNAFKNLFTAKGLSKTISFG